MKTPGNTRFFYFIRKIGVLGEFISQLMIFREVLYQLKCAKKYGRKNFSTSFGELIPVEEIKKWVNATDYREAAQKLRLTVNAK